MKKKVLKKTGIMLMAAALTVAGLGGCAVKNKDKVEDTNSQAVTGEAADGTKAAEEEAVDPNLQFAPPVSGDTLATFDVEGYGKMTFKLFPEVAPKAVENFVTHSKEGYYDGVTFHRVCADFMIQGGDPDGTGYGGESIYGEAFEDEFSDNLSPYRGALCMANSGPNTNSSQFFIVQADASTITDMEDLLKERYDITLGDYFSKAYSIELSDSQISEYREKGGTPWLTRKHTVFGQIVEGLDVLDKISAVKVDENDKPLSAVVINHIEITTAK